MEHTIKRTIKEFYNNNKSIMKEFYNNCAFPITLDIKPAKNISIIAINDGKFNPNLVDYHKDGYDVLLTFYYNGKRWCFHVYNENNSVNVSDIAYAYQGSGTQNVASFTAKYLSEVLNNHDIH